MFMKQVGRERIETKGEERYTIKLAEHRNKE
jgi:hypothetical protein